MWKKMWQKQQTHRAGRLFTVSPPYQTVLHMAITEDLTPIAFIMRLAISRHVAADRNEGGLLPALTPPDPLICQMTGRGPCRGAAGQRLDEARA